MQGISCLPEPVETEGHDEGSEWRIVWSEPVPAVCRQYPATGNLCEGSVGITGSPDVS